jgi:hypothetical protein
MLLHLPIPQTGLQPRDRDCHAPNSASVGLFFCTSRATAFVAHAMLAYSKSVSSSAVIMLPGSAF